MAEYFTLFIFLGLVFFLFAFMAVLLVGLIIWIIRMLFSER